MTICVVRSRIDSEIKAEAVQVFEHMGLSLSEAIRIFLYQTVSKKRIPFSIKAPNSTTIAALRDVAHNRNLTKTSLKKLRKDWNKACGT